MFDHKWKRLIVKGNAAFKCRCVSEARDFYCQSIAESDRILKLFRFPQCQGVDTENNCLDMVSMMVVSHHNMADLWNRYGVLISQTYYLEMAHQKLIDIVRDTRFSEALRATAISELSRTYMALLSHYKTNGLADESALLVDQYSRIKYTFDVVLGNCCQRSVLVH